MRLVAVLALASALAALERPGVEFKVFQFPPDKIPHVDGDAVDWSIVPDSYAIGGDQLRDTVNNTPRDPADLDVKVRVGWVKGMNRLYFLYEASDNYWDFARRDLHNDIFEVVVDGDLSGGPLIPQLHGDPKSLERNGGYFSFHGVHAQNYHIFTPALDKEWTMVWGCQPWIKDLPWANAAYRHNLKPGGSGRLTLEFWITPFDHASCDGPEKSVESKLWEDKVIGLSWAVLDYDDEKASKYRGFWNLSHKTTMYGNASDLVAFKLMPLEPRFRKPVEANWTFQVLDSDRRLVAFRALTHGDVTSWLWDFGDGTTAAERDPVHRFEKGTHQVVTLTVKGPKGEARHTRVWDVTLP
jgi:hypothetical protein